MGRIARKGLDYFPIDTTWETAVKLVKAKYGALEGAGFLTELWASIYRENYYRVWDEEAAILFADEIKKPVEWVREVIAYCLEKGIFSREIYEKHAVLTSHGIQKRYFKSVQALHREYVDYIPGITYPEFLENNNLGGKADKVGGKADNPRLLADKVGGYADAYKGEGIPGNSISGNLRGEERPPSREKSPPAAPFVDIPEEQDEQELYAFTLRRISARKKKPENLESYAKSIMHAEDNVAAFMAEKAGKEAESSRKITRPPDPGPCSCGGEIVTRTIDRGRCTKCGALHEYNPFLGKWLKEAAASTA